MIIDMFLQGPGPPRWGARGRGEGRAHGPGEGRLRRRALGSTTTRLSGLKSSLKWSDLSASWALNTDLVALLV